MLEEPATWYINVIVDSSRRQMWFVGTIQFPTYVFNVQTARLGKTCFICPTEGLEVDYEQILGRAY